jgi:transcriptional regulator with XRE-family HTH domain
MKPRSDITRHLGDLVRNLRLASGLSQEELATRCDLHRTYIGFIERGEKAVTIETADKIARGLKIPLAELMSQLDALRKVR